MSASSTDKYNQGLGDDDHPYLQYLALKGRPKVTVYVASNSQFSGSEVQILELDYCSKYSNIDLSSIFSWFPRLVDVSLKECHINDEGLEALAKCCASLETVNLSWCHSITDSGISSLLRNCRELDTLDINFCSNITGIGFLGCPLTLTCLQAYGIKLTLEGIKAIVSGGGLEYLKLSTRNELSKVGEGSMTMNTEAVLMILKGCPSLRELYLSDFVEIIKPEGWEAIRRNCKSLEVLHLG
ncbi:F-box/LRR-repeat protein 12-like [Papaver somniferum]|uniref:F-box/LRR-repeat protein 12-like n=1 Tax=Papaver somniferum TaxID=3469 RepID=UPI000E702133|nr:F-box/LRR-repeat protein 12-like [Papaver somniferum]